MRVIRIYLLLLVLAPLACVAPSRDVDEVETDARAAKIRRVPANESELDRVVHYIRWLLDDESLHRDYFRARRFPIMDFQYLTYVPRKEVVPVPKDHPQTSPDYGVAQEFFADRLMNEQTGKLHPIATLRARMEKEFRPSERRRLLTSCFDTIRAKNEIARQGPLGFTWLCDHAAIFTTRAETLEALRGFPARPTGVRYDGELGFHVYDDLELRHKVRVLTANINSNREETLALFDREPAAVKEVFRRNSDGLEEADKIEPFDLLASAITGYTMGKFRGQDPMTGQPLNKIQISKLSQKGLALFLRMVFKSGEHIQSYPAMTVARADNTLLLFCANGVFPRRTRIAGPAKGDKWYRSPLANELVEAWYPLVDLKHALKGSRVYTASCNATPYRIELQRLDAAALPEPAALDFTTLPEVRVLISISLVNEIPRSAIDAGVRFATMMGWTVDEAPVAPVSTFKTFTSEFARSHAYVPVMHAMDVNRFHVGTEQSLVARLSKDVAGQDGGTRKLRLTILFPVDSETKRDLIMNQSELAKLMDDRAAAMPGSLFLMNASCSSEKTLMSWSMVFRKSLERRGRRLKVPDLDPASVKDFPYIIGSLRDFGTGSVTEILGHSKYPLTAVEMLTAGKTIDDVLAYLRQESSPGESFSPDYSGDYPELRSSSGFRLNVTGRGIKGENTY